MGCECGGGGVSGARAAAGAREVPQTTEGREEKEGALQLTFGFP